MPQINDISQRISDYVESFGDKNAKYDAEVLSRIRVILKDLTLNPDGTIKTNIGNLRTINRIKKEFGKVIRDPNYQKNVAKVKAFIHDIELTQTAYFTKKFTDFSPKKAVNELKQVAWDDTKSQLTEVGVNENVVNAASDLVSSAVRGGEDFFKLDKKLKDFISGDEETAGIFERYSKTVLTDTIHGFSRNYNNLIAADLELKWYEYSGALVKSSRPWCVAMEHKRYIHESELAKVASGIIDGEQVSKAGLKEGTNGSNVVNRCGGWNCHHTLQPIPAESVPTSIRRNFEPDISADDDEQTDNRPRRK